MEFGSIETTTTELPGVVVGAIQTTGGVFSRKKQLEIDRNEEESRWALLDSNPGAIMSIEGPRFFVL